MANLPEEFMTDFLPHIEDMTLFGKPVMKLSKKELAATIAYLQLEIASTRDQFNRVSVYQAPSKYRKPS